MRSCAECEPNRTPPRRVSIWGRWGGGIGGVTSSGRELAEALNARGVQAETREITSLRQVLRRFVSRRQRKAPAALHILSASSPQAAVKQSLLLKVGGLTSVALIHAAKEDDLRSIRSFPSIYRMVLSKHDQVFVTNETLKSCLYSVGVTAELASPSTLRSADRHPNIPRQRRDDLRLIWCGWASSADFEIYGLDIALDAFQRRRLAGHEDELSVLLYGNEADRLRITASLQALPTGAMLAQPVEPLLMQHYLSQFDVLLRPTTTDGDSLIVREALAAGLRVVATEAAPRPRGVELAAPHGAAFADVLTHGGRESTGAGLGPPLLEILLDRYWHAGQSEASDD